MWGGAHSGARNASRRATVRAGPWGEVWTGSQERLSQRGGVGQLWERDPEERSGETKTPYLLGQFSVQPPSCPADGKAGAGGGGREGEQEFLKKQSNSFQRS